MRRFLGIALVLTIFVFLTSSAALAQDSQKEDPHTFINIYMADYNSSESISVGLKAKVWGNIYGTLNVEPYEATSDLKVQGGLIYLFPHNVLFFKFYGGVGGEYFRDYGFNYDYLVLGTHFLFVFSEMIYPFKEGEEPLYRYGLSLNF